MGFSLGAPVVCFCTPCNSLQGDKAFSHFATACDRSYQMPPIRCVCANHACRRNAAELAKLPTKQYEFHAGGVIERTAYELRLMTAWVLELACNGEACADLLFSRWADSLYAGCAVAAARCCASLSSPQPSLLCAAHRVVPKVRRCAGLGGGTGSGAGQPAELWWRVAQPAYFRALPLLLACLPSCVSS